MTAASADLAVQTDTEAQALQACLRALWAARDGDGGPEAVDAAEQAALDVITANIRAAFARTLPHVLGVEIDSIDGDSGYIAAIVTDAGEMSHSELAGRDADRIEAINEALWAELSSLHPHTDRSGRIRIILTDG